jgi:hypothetical protein
MPAGHVGRRVMRKTAAAVRNKAAETVHVETAHDCESVCDAHCALSLPQDARRTGLGHGARRGAGACIGGDRRRAARHHQQKAAKAAIVGQTLGRGG